MQKKYRLEWGQWGKGKRKIVLPPITPFIKKKN